MPLFNVLNNKRQATARLRRPLAAGLRSPAVGFKVPYCVVACFVASCSCCTTVVKVAYLQATSACEGAFTAEECCELCPPGTYSDAEASFVCSPCSPGYICTGAHLALILFCISDLQLLK